MAFYSPVKDTIVVNRRQFLRLSALAGGGFCLAISLPGCTDSGDLASPKSFQPNAYLRLDEDGKATIYVPESEMGQGVMTALPMLVAEELEIAWDNVHVERAPLDAAYGWQSTGGSNSVRDAWLPMRHAGAAAREMLIAAAAKRFAVPVQECVASEGKIIHAISNQQASYGDLIGLAAQQAIPSEPRLKSAVEFRYIGRTVPRPEAISKVTGNAIYASDMAVPDILTATILHCPVFGGRLKRLDAHVALNIPGVQRVLEISTGIAVIADGFWPAKKGMDALQVEWDLPSEPVKNSAEIWQQLRQGLEQPGVVAQTIGEPSALQSGLKSVQADYESPFQAHVTMEPMSCTVIISDDGFDIWAPTQSPSEALDLASQTILSSSARLMAKASQRLSLGKASIRLHTPLLGGGFGRRLQQDYVIEAVEIAKAMNRSIRLIWTREEDIRHDYYRPAAVSRISATLDESGQPLSWQYKLAGPSIRDSQKPGSLSDGMDRSALSGALDLPYAIAYQRVEYGLVKTPLPLGYWRSVGHSINAFAKECFVDELAHAARIDPVTYRLSLLSSESPLSVVLKRAAKESQWGQVGKGWFQGVAIHSCFGSHIAMVAEITVIAGKIKVHRVVCAIDCGTVVNPDIVKAQIEGGVAFALSATLYGEITLKNGAVNESNFNDYPVLDITQMPNVETYFIDSQEAPGGVGELSVPVLAPAVANALFAATGQRVRRLPLTI